MQTRTKAEMIMTRTPEGLTAPVTGVEDIHAHYLSP